MIKVDISNVWGDLSLPDLLATEQEVFQAHKILTEGKGPGNDYLGWLNLPTFEETDEMRRIRRAAERIRSDSDVFVVVGIGGSYLGPRAAIELVKGQNHNLRGKDPQVFFAGNNLSTRAWQELCALLEGKDFSINIISKSGTTTEPAIATRALRWMLERKYGAEKAKKRIYVTTDPNKGALRQMATEEGYETFVVPDDVGGRYSVLTAVGLLPIAVAGIDIDALMQGEPRAQTEEGKEKTARLIDLICKAVALAMGVALFVLSILKQIDLYSGFGMVGIGLACLAVSLLAKKETT